jgi:hypothetical protein
MPNRKHNKKRNRFKVDLLAAHGRPCPYCGTLMRVDPDNKARSKHYFPSRDHVVPRSKLPGMPVVIVCQKCNRDKCNNDLVEWLEILKSTNDDRYEKVKLLITKELRRSIYERYDI